MDGCAGFAGGLHPPAVVVESVDDGGFSAVFVGCGDGGWESGRVRDVGLRDIVSPVRAAIVGEVSLLAEYIMCRCGEGKEGQRCALTDLCGTVIG